MHPRLHPASFKEDRLLAYIFRNGYMLMTNYKGIWDGMGVIQHNAQKGSTFHFLEFRVVWEGAIKFRPNAQVSVNKYVKRLLFMWIS